MYNRLSFGLLPGREEGGKQTRDFLFARSCTTCGFLACGGTKKKYIYFIFAIVAVRSMKSLLSGDSLSAGSNERMRVRIHSSRGPCLMTIKSPYIYPGRLVGLETGFPK